MKRYSSFKDSGVEWIGLIPSGWDTSPLKHISDVLPSNVDKHILPNEIPVKLCNYTDVYYNQFITKGLELKSGSCNQNEYDKFHLRIGDVIITKDSETPDDIGIPTLVVDELTDVVCGYHLTLMRPHSVKSGFLFRFIQSHRTRKYFEINSSGITRYSLGKSSIENLVVPLPPLHEQQHIVSYLDEKTSLIDTLIQSKQKKITLLKEKRTSLINHIVTKGLNPNVEMKDSGVEWIGEIPRGWVVDKVKYHFNIVKNISGELGYDVLSVTQKGLKIKDITTGDGQLSMDYSKYQLVNVGDFVMNHMDLLTGYVDVSSYMGVTSPDYRVFTNTSDDDDKFYFLYVFQQCYRLKIFYGLGQGVSTFGRWRLSSDEFNNFLIPLPPLNEQHQIVEYLDNETSLIDKTITIEERKIELLKEYRQSLISDVVTGKICVLEDG